MNWIHEQYALLSVLQASAVFAADAVARLSGTVGVAAVTAGPGLTNTVTAVKNAQMAESPVLLMGGAAASILKVSVTTLSSLRYLMVCAIPQKKLLKAETAKLYIEKH